MMTAVICFLSLTAGNFISVALFDTTTIYTATERSFFQGVAILLYWFLQKQYGGKK